MKCNNHPRLDASIVCSECEKNMCEKCVTYSDDGSPICKICEIKFLGNVVAENVQKKKIEVSIKELTKNEKGKKQKTVIRTFVALIVLAIGAANLYLLTRPSVPFWNEYQSEETPSASILTIDFALQDYAEDHNGEFPENLDVLIGKYIDSDDLVQNDLVDFYYSRPTPVTYELSMVESGDNAFADLTFTESGLK